MPRKQKSQIESLTINQLRAIASDRQLRLDNQTTKEELIKALGEVTQAEINAHPRKPYNHSPRTIERRGYVAEAHQLKLRYPQTSSTEALGTMLDQFRQLLAQANELGVFLVMNTTIEELKALIAQAEQRRATPAPDNEQETEDQTDAQATPSGAAPSDAPRIEFQELPAVIAQLEEEAATLLTQLEQVSGIPERLQQLATIQQELQALGEGDVVTVSEAGLQRLALRHQQLLQQLNHVGGLAEQLSSARQTFVNAVRKLVALGVDMDFLLLWLDPQEVVQPNQGPIPASAESDETASSLGDLLTTGLTTGFGLLGAMFGDLAAGDQPDQPTQNPNQGSKLVNALLAAEQDAPVDPTPPTKFEFKVWGPTFKRRCTVHHSNGFVAAVGVLLNGSGKGLFDSMRKKMRQDFRNAIGKLVLNVGETTDQVEVQGHTITVTVLE